MKKSGCNTGTKTTGKHERTEIISRGNTKHGKILTKTFGTNRPITETTEKERTMEMRRRTTERL